MCCSSTWPLSVRSLCLPPLSCLSLSPANRKLCASSSGRRCTSGIFHRFLKSQSRTRIYWAMKRWVWKLSSLRRITLCRNTAFLMDFCTEDELGLPFTILQRGQCGATWLNCQHCCPPVFILTFTTHSQWGVISYYHTVAPFFKKKKSCYTTLLCPSWGQ